MKVLLLLVVGILLFGCVAENPSTSTTLATSITVGGNIMANDVVKSGDLISVDYVGTLQNGSLFDTSIEAEAKKGGLPLRPSYAPLSFTVGAGQMIAGFDAAVLGMKLNEEKTVTIPAAQAYGERSEENVVSISLDNLPPNVTVGLKLQASSGAVGTVTKVANGNATIDFNHDLAGKTLVFKITVKSIRKA